MKDKEDATHVTVIDIQALWVFFRCMKAFLLE